LPQVAREIINDHKHKPLTTHKQQKITRHVPQQEKYGALKNSSQGGVETIQLKVMSTWETNIMTKQTWITTKAST
jgi:hypothetical protein